MQSSVVQSLQLPAMHDAHSLLLTRAPPAHTSFAHWLLHQPGWLPSPHAHAVTLFNQASAAAG